jgi:hypothetical protein
VDISQSCSKSFHASRFSYNWVICQTTLAWQRNAKTNLALVCCQRCVCDPPHKTSGQLTCHVCSMLSVTLGRPPLITKSLANLDMPQDISEIYPSRSYSAAKTDLSSSFFSSIMSVHPSHGFSFY